MDDAGPTSDQDPLHLNGTRQPVPILPWCCRHKLTLTYIATVVTAELVLLVGQAAGWLG